MVERAIQHQTDRVFTMGTVTKATLTTLIEADFLADNQAADQEGDSVQAYGHPMPNAQCLVPNAQCLTPNAQCPMPNAQCPVPSAQCPMPNAQCPMPNA
eukprot:scaffold51138_cov60-Phaeocystis_antarctica.AAC.9